MRRASFLIALALSTAAAAQQPPPLTLPGSEPELPLPGVKEQKAKKKDAPPPPLPLPGLEAKPAEKAPPPQATPASARPAEHRAGGLAAEKPPAARAPAPPAAAAPSADRLGDMRLRPDPDQQLWTVRAFVGGERSTEQDYTEASSLGRIGAEATRWFSGSWLVRGEFDWRASTQQYVPLHSATNSSVRVDENRFDALATVGYDVGPRLAESGRLELTPMLGLAYVGIRNQAFPSDLIGPDLGGRVRWALSPSVIAHLTVGYTFNLAVASTQNSALKSPKGDFSTRAGLVLPLSGGYALELDYSGDVIAFENTYRVAHGAALGFGTSF
jgi:hypothetical protein